jgi:hypothetical protein
MFWNQNSEDCTDKQRKIKIHILQFDLIAFFPPLLGQRQSSLLGDSERRRNPTSRGNALHTCKFISLTKT